MATIIPFGTVTVGATTVTFCSSTFFSAGDLATDYPPPVHAVYFQVLNGVTGVISIKYAGDVIAVLAPPAATGPLPEHWLKVDDSDRNELDIKPITLTGTNSGDKVSGYVVIC